MLAVSVEFLFATFRGDPDGTANTGRLTTGEWPPAPSRLFAALVAADGTGDRCTVTDGGELLWLESQSPPLVYADPQISHCTLQSRYVVKHTGRPANNTHQEYVARSGTVFRPGVRVAVRDPRVVYFWDVDVPDSVLESLRYRAARVGYLGTADSPVRLRVSTRLPRSVPEQAFKPDDRGDTVLGVPQTGDTRILDHVYEQWRDRGASVTRLQFPSLQHPVRYRSPQFASNQESGVVVAWLRLGTAVSGRRVTALTTLFKNAVLSQYQRLHGDPPEILHGHGFKEKGYELARYLALPDVGYPRSRGRIHGLALWTPKDADDVTRRKASDAAVSIRRLTGTGVDVAVAPHENRSRPIAAKPSRWLRSSRRWTTAFPAVHERRGKLDLDELARWCAHAGLPSPVAFRSGRTPFVKGAVDLAPIEINRPGRPALPYSHVDLQFAESITGPVVIGGGRQRGLGLCIPIEGSLIPIE